MNAYIKVGELHGEHGLEYGVWGMEFNFKFGFTSLNDINKHVWYSI